MFTALLAALLTGLMLFTCLKVRQIEQKFPPEGAFVQAAGTKIHGVHRGSGRPVVFIHGSFGSSKDFTLSVFGTVCGAYDCLALDRPGHGYSDRPKADMTLFDHARYLHEAVQQFGLTRPVIAGHSLGGAVALAYALEYPDDVAGLLLIIAYVTPFEGPPNIIHRIPAIPVIGELYLWAFITPFGSGLARKIGEKVFSPGAPVESYLDVSIPIAMRPNHFRSNAADIRLLNPALESMIARYGELHCPVTLLVGDSDLIAPVERHARRILNVVPHARLQMIERGGHQPAFSHPEVIRGALDEIWSQASRTS